jgi:hypothetical protein
MLQWSQTAEGKNEERLQEAKARAAKHAADFEKDEQQRVVT